jgi:uncharacterized C2H2 Zn-finger protein
MANKISRCNICGEFLNSKRELKEHINKNHRITAPKMKSKVIKTALLWSNIYLLYVLTFSSYP